MARPPKDKAPDLNTAQDLTAGLIERLTCPGDKAQAFMRDTKTPGLRVRVTTAGAKSFVFEAHGIGDRLALLWVMEDEQRARAVIDYVELKNKKKQVKCSTTGYIRKLIEDKAEIGLSPYGKEKNKAQENQTSLAIDGANRIQQEDFKLTFKAITTTARI